MTPEEFKQLKPGDIIQHADGEGYVVTYTLNLGPRPTFMAVRQMMVSNPSEWKKVDR